ncbi:MAG: hypothetical protein A3G92_02385 [Deltaproteobacteria bacterium RIFCSPLOWO2_12_FULL_38_8]|nr:MAG: hypothetical protein A3G92_02385 [Deltaproteobacteria bacterium RIFCSPLOWO2_12_FULL_38_8]
MTSKWIGILGFPLTHSLSKQIHIEKLQKANLNYEFRILEWSSVDVDRHLQELKKDPTCVGFSVTMPYKEKIISYLDHCDEFAKKVSAVNCVKNVGGQWWGYNTDAPGFMKHFKLWNPLPPKEVHVVVIGAGATARTLSYALAQEGYRNFTFINRTEEKAKAWAQKIKTFFSNIQTKVLKWGDPSPCELRMTNVFLMNTTPFSPVILSAAKNLISPAWIFDVAYNPPSLSFPRKRESMDPRLRGDDSQCRERCFYTMNGWLMFEAQADLAFKIWTR